LGLPIPDDVDGRVLTEVFEKGSKIGERAPEYVSSGYYATTEKEKLKHSIKKLETAGKI